MNPEITIVHYSSNLIDEESAKRVRQDLLRKTEGARIISVTHKPIDLGENICVGEIGVSLYSLFKQVLIGAREVRTKFMACSEDDYLYSDEHFNFVPPRDDTFYYDSNRWGLNKDGRYFWRPRTIFGMCIAPTQAMINTLEDRFNKYKSPNTSKLIYFSEPGKYEGPLGVPLVKMERVYLDTPTITFNHHLSLGKRRMVRDTDIVKKELPYWGDGATLWKNYMGDNK